MIKIGITGGIGAGKSYICNLLRQRGIPVYNCDEEAKRLIRFLRLFLPIPSDSIPEDAVIREFIGGGYFHE
jgi:hypothetical protein